MRAIQRARSDIFARVIRAGFLLCCVLSIAGVMEGPRLAKSVAADRNDSAERRATLAFVGDILLHDTLQVQASRHLDEGGYRTVWFHVETVLREADFTYGNLEGPVAEGVRCDGGFSRNPAPPSFESSVCPGSGSSAVYTQFPRFNYPPHLLDSLRLSGFDIVSTANNHALDRFPRGVDLTLEALESRGIYRFGSRKTNEEGDTSTIAPVSGRGGVVRVGWVGCTFSLNGLPDPHGQVSLCYTPAGDPSEELLARVRSLDGRDDVDVVVATPHWGVEYSPTPTSRQRRLAAALVGAGASAVVGTHPHVVQPLEYLTVNGRSGLVVYSLGNFVADQYEPATRASVVLHLDVVVPAGGPVRITNVQCLPMYMAHAPEAGAYSRTLVPLDTRSDNSPEGEAALRYLASVLPEGSIVGRVSIDRGPENEPGHRRGRRSACTRHAYL